MQELEKSEGKNENEPSGFGITSKNEKVKNERDQQKEINKQAIMKAKDDLYNEFFQASATGILSPFKVQGQAEIPLDSKAELSTKKQNSTRNQVLKEDSSLNLPGITQDSSVA